jgi:hypothetical protein
MPPTDTLRPLCRVMLLEKKAMTVKEFKELAESEKYSHSTRALRDDVASKNYEGIENSFWKNLSYGEPPCYGADLSGSLFNKDMSTWNLDQLDTMLHRMMNERDIPGVLSGYLYFGMWRAFFGIHVEDMNLFSINYVHMGAPKHWYATSPHRADRVESLTQGQWPLLHRQCSEFMRHKNTMIAPTVLMRESIPVSHTVQEQGQFVVTFPHGYHWGFNQGFNMAEATNFATEAWIPFGEKAKYCKCQEDSVRIHMPTLTHRLKLFKMGVPNYKSYDPVNATPLELAPEESSGSSSGRMGGAGRMGKAAAKTSPKAGKKSPKQRNATASTGTDEPSPISTKRRGRPERGENWAFFCACGMVAGSKEKAAFPKGGRAFCCDLDGGGCGTWGHIDCYLDYESKAMKSLPAAMRCHQCRGADFYQFKCLCGSRFSSDWMPSAEHPVPSGELWQCVSCRKWAHQDCYTAATGHNNLKQCKACDQKEARKKLEDVKQEARAEARAQAAEEAAEKKEAEEKQRLTEEAERAAEQLVARTNDEVQLGGSVAVTHADFDAAQLKHSPVRRRVFVRMVHSTNSSTAGSDKLLEQTAWLQYRLSLTKTKLELKKLHVPKTLRGLNLAEMLCQAVFEHILKDDQRVKLTAGYAKKVYASKNPHRLARCLPVDGVGSEFSEDESSKPALTTMTKVKPEKRSAGDAKPTNGKRAKVLKHDPVTADAKKYNTTGSDRADRAARKASTDAATARPEALWPGADSEWAAQKVRNQDSSPKPTSEAKRQKMEKRCSANTAPVTPEQENIQRYEGYLRKRGLTAAAAHHLTRYLVRLDGNSGTVNSQPFKTRLVSIASQLSEQVQLRRRLHDTDDDPFQFTLALERVFPTLQQKRQAMGATAKEMLLNVDSESRQLIGSASLVAMEPVGKQLMLSPREQQNAQHQQNQAEKEARKLAMTERLAARQAERQKAAAQAAAARMKAAEIKAAEEKAAREVQAAVAAANARKAEAEARMVEAQARLAEANARKAQVDAATASHRVVQQAEPVAMQQVQQQPPPAEPRVGCPPVAATPAAPGEATVSGSSTSSGSTVGAGSAIALADQERQLLRQIASLPAAVVATLPPAQRKQYDEACRMLGQQ